MTLFSRVFASLFWAVLLLFPQVRGADFDLVGREMMRMLQNSHYARLPADGALSERILELYVDDLDANRSYFLQYEVDAFRQQYGRTLHDRLSTREALPVATLIFNIYRARVAERNAFVQNLLRTEELKLESEHAYHRNRGELPWPANVPALRRLWREGVEDALIAEMVTRDRLRHRAKEIDRPVTFRATAREKVSAVYADALKKVEVATMEEVADRFFSAVAQAHDPHTEYLGARGWEQFKIDLANEVVGVGIQLSTQSDTGHGEAIVKGIVTHGPADRGGQLQLGDRITAVSANDDGRWVSILFKPLGSVIEHVLGEAGAMVGLRVVREVDGVDETLEVSIERGMVKIKENLASGWVFEVEEEERARKFASIAIPSFYRQEDGRGVAKDVSQLLERVVKEKVEGLILDLRGNHGGYLYETIKVVGFFIDQGPVVQVKSLNGQVEPKRDPSKGAIYTGPLIVLTDRASASAAEILAGALQDYGRAVIMGAESTFGKGTVQEPKDIADFMPIFSDRDRAGYLKLTTQKYYRASGSSVQLKGVVPDLILPSLSQVKVAGEASRQFALPHDIIRKAPGFRPLSGKKLHLEALKKRSRQRVESSSYFKDLQKDIERLKRFLEGDEVSLDLTERLREERKAELERQERLAEKKVRYDELKKRDRERLTIQRMGLDDLRSEKLPVVDAAVLPENMKMLPDEFANFEDRLEWPSGLDLMEREGLQVLDDLIALEEARQIAKVQPRSGADPRKKLVK